MCTGGGGDELSHSDRMAKYNQLFRIEEELSNLAVYGYKKQADHRFKINLSIKGC